jgi:hypothetical protein
MHPIRQLLSEIKRLLETPDYCTHWYKDEFHGEVDIGKKLCNRDHCTCGRGWISEIRFPLDVIEDAVIDIDKVTVDMCIEHLAHELVIDCMMVWDAGRLNLEEFWYEKEGPGLQRIPHRECLNEEAIKNCITYCFYIHFNWTPLCRYDEWGEYNV